MAVHHHPSGKLTVPDVLIVGLLLLAAVFSSVFLLSGEDGSFCVITCDGISETFPLSEDRTVSVRAQEYTLTVTIRNGTVSVTDSDCPDRVCVRSGTVSRAGQAIVCIPAGVTVRITGADDPGYDAVAGGVM